MRFLSTLSALFGFSQLASPGTDVVIVSNNDLDPSNPNRVGALLLRTPLTCSQAISTCYALQETLLPPPTDSGFTPDNLTSILVSDRRGTALTPGSNVWIAGHSGCAVFTVGGLSPTPNSFARLPALCTNSAPLTRSNTTYDTTRQIDVWTPKAGVLRGFRDKFTWRFLGIKYATSTAGQGRFQPPTPLSVPSNAVRTALTYDSFCAQATDNSNGYLWHDEEDCLSLNVYSPIVRGQNTHAGLKLPVMFYIHGGALNAGGSGPFPYNMTTEGYVGSSTGNVYDGTNLVSYGGVVLVTIHYRLTAFGWFNASNAALKDTLLALQWVQDNIESFGGDPTKVLIFGESAGGTMTRYLLGTNPKYTHGLFSAAILMSDFSTTFPFYSPALALETSLTLAKHLGCASDTSTSLSDAHVACVQGKPAMDIALAAHDLHILWDAIVDGDYILTDIESSIRDGMYARVPTLRTTTECDYCYFLSHKVSPTAPPSAYREILSTRFTPDEVRKILDATALYPYETAPAEGGMSGTVRTFAHLINDLLALCPSTYLAALASSTTNAGNAYHTVFAVGLGSPFTPRPEICRDHVCHADDLYWVFGTAETDGLYQPLSEERLAVMRDVMKRWTEMAWSGSPNYVGAEVEWKAYESGNEAVVNVTGHMSPGYRMAQCEFIVNGLGLKFGYEDERQRGLSNVQFVAALDKDTSHFTELFQYRRTN